jgi:hypothetical protein
MVKSNSASGYVFGVQKSGTGATTTFDATEHHAGETVFLVGKYDFTVSPNSVKLWINPAASTFGAPADPASGFISTTTGTDGYILDRFNMRQNTASSVPAAMQWDELRIGTSWAVVTPSPSPPLLTGPMDLPSGAFQFFYANTAGSNYSVYASTNFVNWTSLGAATQTTPGYFQFTDPAAAGYARRFYRLHSP